MKKTKILSVVLAFLSCAALLGSCDYWKEDYYKNGGDSASEASGGSGSSTGGSSGLGSDCPAENMTQEERAIHQSLLGTRWKNESVSLAERNSDSHFACVELTINANGSGTHTLYYEDRNGTKINDGSLTEFEKRTRDNFNEFGTITHCYIRDAGGYTDEINRVYGIQTECWLFYNCDDIHFGHQGNGIGVFFDSDGDGVLDKIYMLATGGYDATGQRLGQRLN